MNSKRNILVTAFASLVALAAAAAAAAPVAVVTDIQGRAVNAQPAGREVTLLSEIEGEARIQLDEKSKLVAVYYSTGSEYTVRGPAVVQFKADAPQSVSGVAPEKRAVLAAAGKDVRLKPGGLARAAYMMMGAPASLKLLALNDTRTLELKPEFRWTSVEAGQSYDVRIMSEAGAVVFATTTTGTSAALPPEVSLVPGKRYTWRVTAPLSDGTSTASVGEFVVAAADLRSQVEAVRPAQTAALSDKIAFAIWLEQHELRDEARKYWDIARAQWPNNARVEALANRE